MRFPKILPVFAILTIFTLLPNAGFAQAVPSRFALVIGNGDYSELAKLANPANDAADMAAALKSLGFETQLLIDADLGAMEDAVVSLGNRLAASSGSTGFFYYAGHGVQSGGINYLIPADARIPGESFLKTKALAAQAVLDTLQGTKNGLNVIVLDACRDNPFGWSRSGARGLSVVSTQPTGSILVYATSAGSVAQDGTGRNGVFTRELLKNLQTPDLEIKEVFNRTGAQVQAATGGKQVPAIYNQFFNSVYLGASAPQDAPALSSASTVPGGKPADLMVRTQEEGAEVFVNGMLKGRAPLLVPALPSGRNFHVEARTDRSSGALDLALKPGEFREISIAMAALTGNLVIASNESAVRVLLDGKDMGDFGTGVLRDVPIGTYALELAGKGLWFGTTITVTTGATVQVSARVQPVGSLAVEVPAGASIVVAGGGQSWTQVGAGVLDNLPVGSYSLSAGGGEWVPANANLAIAKGQQATWEPWKGGTIAFEVSPADAICILDGGQSLKTSSPAFGMAPGSYKAILRKPGFSDKEIAFAVAIGRQASVKAGLERLKPGIIKLAPPGVDLRLVVEGQTLVGVTDIDGCLRFEGVFSGYPVSVGFESSDAQVLSVQATSASLGEGETVVLEVPTGLVGLPWIASDTRIAIGGKKLAAAGGRSWTSVPLPTGTYRVDVSGTWAYSADVQVEKGGVTEVPGYREAVLPSLASARKAAAKVLANRPAKTAAGLASLATGFLGVAGAGTAYFLVDQAAIAYREAPDSASASARWRDVQSFQILLSGSAAVGGLGLVLSPIFLLGGSDPASAGLASLATGLLGLVGAGTAYLLADQAMTAYRAAPDSANATARWKDVQRFQVLLGTSAAVGGAGLIISTVLLAGKRDPGALQRSIDALDEGIRALGK
jgi:hypothetical protein